MPYGRSLAITCLLDAEELRRILLSSDVHVVVTTNSNMNALTELQAIAVEALAALDTGRQIEPFSSRTSSFSLDDAYRVTAAVRKIREARGN